MQHGGGEALWASDPDDLAGFLVLLTDSAGAWRPIERPGDATCR